ncbi:hypothetical protein [Halegenticoccus tardaugens]|uniref:hypothetical protein n=1 Tax=Halegenticoccus tardaugens TaxID=2071624 RepID=UPI00100C2036|nr:hypothetical protein [Halegenticoccus tardaugens]
MLRAILALFGLLELLFPRSVIDYSMTLAFDQPVESEPKPWTVTAARIEGLLILLFALGKLPRRPAASR